MIVDAKFTEYWRQVMKKLVPDPQKFSKYKTIAEAFDSMAAAGDQKRGQPMSPDVREVLRGSFYAGALFMFAKLTAGDVDEASLRTRMGALHDELSQFLTDTRIELENAKRAGR